MNSHNTTSKPFYSVLICSYERPEYLSQCIQSVLDNDFTDYEIVISDDCSKRIDEIAKVINPFTVKNGNIRFFQQEENLGWSENRNFLLDVSQGRYVIILGDDDKFYTNTLSTLHDYIHEYPQYDLYGVGYSVTDEDDRLIYSRRSPKPFELSLDQPDLAKHLLFSEVFPFWFYHPLTICCNSDSISNIRFNKDAFIGDDFLFLFDCINDEKKMLVIPELLFIWRKIQRKDTKGFKNISFGSMNNLIARRNIFYLLRDRVDLKSFVEQIVNTNEFRNRFLFQPILASRIRSDEGLCRLNLAKEDILALQSYTRKRRPAKLYTFWGYFSRFFVYLRLLRFRGICQLLSTSRQRLQY